MVNVLAVGVAVAGNGPVVVVVVFASGREMASWMLASCCKSKEEVERLSAKGHIYRRRCEQWQSASMRSTSSQLKFHALFSSMAILKPYCHARDEDQAQWH